MRRPPDPPRVQAQAHLVRARYRQENELSGAADDVDRRGNWPPTRPTCWWRPRSQPGAKNDLDGARKLLERGVGLHPQGCADVSRPGRDRGPGRAVRGGRRRSCAGASRPCPTRTTCNGTLAELLIQMGKSNEAREVIARLRTQDNVSRPTVDYLDARLLLNEGQRAEGGPAPGKGPRADGGRSRPGGPDHAGQPPARPELRAAG